MPVLPGETIAILGGGQLGRMSAMAARSLGYRVNVLDPEPACAARGVSDLCVTGRFDDVDALERTVQGASVVTLEIERIPADALAVLAARAPVRPGAHVLRVVQERQRQKAWLVDHGFPVGDFRAANSSEELTRALDELRGRAVIKASHGGYDGRGQLWVDGAGEGDAAWRALGGAPVIAERALALHAEFSVLVARRPGGEIAVYPPAFNVHEQGQLAWSVIPAPLPRDVLARGVDLACRIAAALDVAGLLVVEMFMLADGTVLVNELAPRPHNSFHATENACATSQFEQHVRAVCDLPLGATDLVRPAAIANLLGDLWLMDSPPDLAAALSMPGVRVVLYGKRGPRAGRKMGHLVAVGASPADALARADEAFMRFAPPGSLRPPRVTLPDDPRSGE